MIVVAKMISDSPKLVLKRDLIIEFNKSRPEHIQSGKQGGTLSLKKCLRELFRVERLQVVRLLAQADEFDGQAEFLLDGHHHTAFAGAVELGHNETRKRHGFVELARLLQCVHAGAAVEYQQYFMRRAGH